MDSSESIYPRSYRLIRRLSLVYGVAALGIALSLLLALLPAGVAVPVQALAHEAIAGGLAATVLAALLLSLTGLLGTLVLTLARFRHAASLEQGRTATGTGWREVLNHPGVAARLGQGCIVPAGALLIYLALQFLWPTEATADNSSSANILASFVFGLAFVALVSERIMVAFPAPQLPEAPTLRRLHRAGTRHHARMGAVAAMGGGAAAHAGGAGARRSRSGTSVFTGTRACECAG